MSEAQYWNVLYLQNGDPQVECTRLLPPAQPTGAPGILIGQIAKPSRAAFVRECASSNMILGNPRRPRWATMRSGRAKAEERRTNGDLEQTPDRKRKKHRPANADPELIDDRVRIEEIKRTLESNERVLLILAAVSISASAFAQSPPPKSAKKPPIPQGTK